MVIPCNIAAAYHFQVDTCTLLLIQYKRLRSYSKESFKFSAKMRVKKLKKVSISVVYGCGGVLQFEPPNRKTREQMQADFTLFGFAHILIIISFLSLHIQRLKYNS